MREFVALRRSQKFLEPVAARDTTDAEVSYYLGIAYEGLGHNREARDSYEAAERLPAFRAAAGVRLAELSARAENLQQAESYLRSATRSAPDDPRTAEELSAVLEAEGQKEEAQSLANEWLARFPQRYFLLEQIGKPDLQHLGDDAERVLNVASEYMRLGMYSRALDVLVARLSLERYPMKLNRECSLRVNIQWSPTSAHIVARNSANPPQQISMLPRTFQRIMYFPTAQKIWKFCGPPLVSMRRMRLHIICSEPYTFHEV